MNPKTLIPILIGMVVVISLSYVYFQPEPMLVPSHDVDFTYSDAEKIRENLATQNIFMSPPTEIIDYTVSQYCTLFDGGTQKFVKHCVTTALTSSDGTSLGNFNMGGSTNAPVMALAIIESNRLLDSRIDEIDFVFPDDD